MAKILQMPRPRKRLLFVDDERAIRETLQFILTRYGYAVTLASSVSEALERIQEKDFDILLCDLNIEGNCDGFDVIRAMQEKQPRCVTMVLTAYPAIESAVEGIRLHIDDYIIKPSSADALVALLAEKLRRDSDQPNEPLVADA